MTRYGLPKRRMSKRASTMVTLKKVIERVGTDIARFFFLNRKADAHLDFNIALALKKTLAQLFHKYYSKNRAINLEDIPQSRARLLLNYRVAKYF